ncbi:hypothetical protein DXG01_011735 [Tephrocybe rancida]|nr:hypothetical protein DXG01_011735 [Tephrocybe rancida]
MTTVIITDPSPPPNIFKIPLDLNIGLDIVNDDGTAAAILRGLGALMDHTFSSPASPAPHADDPLPLLPTTPHPSHLRPSHPPPKLPKFTSTDKELDFLRAAYTPLQEQAQELRLLKDQGHDVARLKDVITTMVDKLRERGYSCLQEVGTERKLGGQALILDVEGTWRELTGVVNKLATNLTSQVRSIANVVKAVALRQPLQTTRGRCSGRDFGLEEYCRWSGRQVNQMCSSLTDQVRSITNVTTAVAPGDLTQTIEISVERGEMSSLKAGWRMGRLDEERQRECFFRQLESENMASNLTDQRRPKAIALSDLEKQVNVDMQGEMLELKLTVNSMASQLKLFANEVTRVSLEVGTEGRLGG